MDIPTGWRSRRPFVFSDAKDIIVAKPLDDLEVPSARASGGRKKSITNSHDGGLKIASATSKDKRGRESFSQERAVAPQSNLHPSLSPETAQPQFIWQVDVLAGNISEVTHDTYDLEKQLATKNRWEEANQGRAERGQASLAFFMEKKNIQRSMRHMNTTDPNVASSEDKTTEGLIDMLALALDKEEQRPVVAAREARLISLAEYKEHIQADFEVDLPPPTLIQKEIIEAQSKLRVDRREASEVQAKAMATMVFALNEMLREDAAVRVSSLTSQAMTTSAAFGYIWEGREKFRAETDKLIQAHKDIYDQEMAELAAKEAANAQLLADEVRN
jgi:cytochrome c556